MSFIRRSLEGKQGVRKYIGPKRVVLFITFIALIFWIWNIYQTGSLSPATIELYRSKYPVQSVIFFIALYAASVFACLPSLPLNLAAGFFWGGLLGGVYSTLGVTFGGLISFSVARGIFGQPLNRRFETKWLDTVQNEFSRNGWKFVAFARINPIIPTGPLNYLLGLTSLSSRDFIWVTSLFLLPPACAVAYIGSTLQSLTTSQSETGSIVTDLIISSLIVTLIYLARFAYVYFQNKKTTQ